MPVPNSGTAIVPKEKILNYLLNTEHPEGKPKAEFFLKHGYSAQNWQELQTALLQHISNNQSAKTIQGQHGTKYIVEGELVLLDDTKVTIRSIWIVSTSSPNPRLVTAFPIG